MGIFKTVLVGGIFEAFKVVGIFKTFLVMGIFKTFLVVGIFKTFLVTIMTNSALPYQLQQYLRGIKFVNIHGPSNDKGLSLY